VIIKCLRLPKKKFYERTKADLPSALQKISQFNIKLLHLRERTKKVSIQFFVTAASEKHVLCLPAYRQAEAGFFAKERE